jgi:hypothetical protein
LAVGVAGPRLLQLPAHKMHPRHRQHAGTSGPRRDVCKLLMTLLVACIYTAC